MIYLDRQSKIPLYSQIYDQIKRDILNGNLKEEELLIGSRAFADVLGVSRNTVNTAYSQLIAEGYVVSVKGTGLRVRQVPSLAIKKESIKKSSPASINHEKTNSKIVYDLTNSSQTSDLFPKKLWKRYTVECLDFLTDESKLASYQEKQGELYLRKNLLTYLRKIRGVHCEERQIVITCGLQQIKIKTVPIDENGLIVADLPYNNNIRAIYTTPSHQFPTGATLTIDRRYKLLEWAERNDSFILEDDFDSELRYYSKPIPALQSIDENDRVVYLGTFSKTLSPSIRMGYMILPPHLCQRYLELFEPYNSTVPLLNQYVVARLIETGHYERHIRRLNQTFRKRLEQFTKELDDVKDKIKISSNGSGQYFLLTFTQPVEQSQLIDSALNHGVKVYSTMKFWQEKAACPPNTLFLGFSKIDLVDIPDCVARLKQAWSKWL